MILDNIGAWLQLVCAKKIKRPDVFGLDGFGQHFTVAALLKENEEADTTRVSSESIIFVNRLVQNDRLIEIFSTDVNVSRTSSHSIPRQNTSLDQLVRVLTHNVACPANKSDRVAIDLDEILFGCLRGNARDAIVESVWWSALL